MNEWKCDSCGEKVLFRQPELPQEDYNSEENESRSCPVCNDSMYFDWIEEE